MDGMADAPVAAMATVTPADHERISKNAKCTFVKGAVLITTVCSDLRKDVALRHAIASKI